MIKINLLKSRISPAPNNSGGGSGGGGGGAAGGGDAYASVAYPSGSGGLDARETLIKLLCLSLCTLGIWLYESQNIRSLTNALNTQTAQMQDLEQKAQAKDKEVEGIKDLERQARELEDKLKILKLLSKLRLREVKTLDFIQSSIPEKVWLKTMTYEGEKENMENGRFNFNGLAVSTEELTEFVKRLEDSAYLSEVIVMKNQEVNATGTGKAVLRDFNFTAQVEVHK